MSWPAFLVLAWLVVAGYGVVLCAIAKEEPLPRRSRLREDLLRYGLLFVVTVGVLAALAVLLT